MKSIKRRILATIGLAGALETAVYKFAALLASTIY